jgi:hypothetical protein
MLSSFIKDHNRWRKAMGKRRITKSGMTAEDAQELADFINSGLSPENLHQDGEAPSGYAGRRYSYLKVAGIELQRQCKANGLPMPIIMEA